MKSAILFFCLVASLLSQSLAADIFEPFTTANLNPFTRLQGIPLARSATLAEKGALEVSVQLDVANNFTNSTRGAERINIDGETHRTTLSLRYGLSDRWELGIDLPYVRHTGGSLDGFIENWHDWFGLPNGGREDVPQDLLNYRWQKGAGTQVNLTNSDSGAGDISVYAGFQLSRTEDRTWAIRTGVKLDNGDTNALMGSGGTDFFTSLHMTQSRLWGRDSLTLHGNLGAVLVDEPDFSDAEAEDWILFGSSTLAWQVHERVSLKSQLDFNSAPYDSSLKEIGDFSTQLTLGGTVVLGQTTRLDIGVTEDIITDTSPDVVFHLAVRRRF